MNPKKNVEGSYPIGTDNDLEPSPPQIKKKKKVFKV